MTEPTGNVLVVGAGPTGLALAHSLLRQGFTPRIIDAGEGTSPESRALATHARTLEVLGESVANKLLEIGKPIDRANIYSGDELLVDLSLSGTPTLYSFVLAISQGDVERALVRELSGEGVQVEWRTRLRSLEQDADGVSVVIENPDEYDTTHRFDYVVGCDGVRSPTREAAGIELEAHGDHRWWVLADVKFGQNKPDHATLYGCLGPAGVLAMIPLQDEDWWRVVAVGGVSDERPEVTLESIDALMKERTSFHTEILAERWLSSFRIREHVANTYRAGRVLIAGDAAHAHSPLGGQGMNTGIQDAYNLGWKLAAVLRGASPSLLDSYISERRPVGAELVRNTGRGTRVIYSSSSWLVWLRNRALQKVMQLDMVTERVRNSIEMLVIAYPDSDVVDEHLGQVGGEEGLLDRDARREFQQAPGPGERAPLELRAVRVAVDRPEHSILLFGLDEAPNLTRAQSASSTAVGLDPASFHTIAVVKSEDAARALEGDAAFARVLVDADNAIHKAFGAGKGGAMVVVRPDGYIGFRSQPIAPVAFADWWKNKIWGA